jgi:MFS family permease
MMPVFARDVLDLDATGYGALVSGVGLGAIAAAIGAAGLAPRARTPQLVVGSSLAFGLLLTAPAFAPGFWTALAGFTLAGCTMALNGVVANTMLQLQAPDHLRGRVMSFYSFTVLGMAPFGSLQAGWVTEHFGVRVSLAVGGSVCFLVAAVVGRRILRLDGAGKRRATPLPGHPERSEGSAGSWE